MKAKYQDEQLKVFQVPALNGGYNAYTNSKTAIEDSEMPYGFNVQVDDTFTGITPVNGSVRVSGEIASGYAVKHLHIHRTDAGEEVIGIAGQVIKKTIPTVATLTGVTPSADQDYMSFQGGLKSYFFNGVDNPIVYDGNYLTSLASNLPTNGCGMVASYTYRRCFVRDKVKKDTLWYSGMYSPEDSRNFLMNFVTGGDNYAGYYTHRGGSGVEITSLFEVNGVLHFGTNQGEICSVTIAATTGITNSVSLSVQTVVNGSGVSSPFSPVQIGTDLHYFYDTGWYSLGYQQLFGNLLRASVLSKRVKPELGSVLHKNKLSACVYKDTAYISYGNGARNDTVLKLSFKDRNYQYSNWSAPIKGWNVSKFVVYTDNSGNKHLYGGSSLSTDSYIYEYDVENDNNSVAYNKVFETKSFDCKSPGVVKYFAFIDVFYSMVYGSLSYEVFIDEDNSISGTRALGNSPTGGFGIGSQIIGTFMVGDEIDDDATMATLKLNNKFRIPCQFKKGQKISIRFSNNNTGETFKINGLAIYYQEGSVYEQTN